MDSDIILVKIESLRKCIGRIESKRPLNVEILESDIDLQDIITVNLERAVQQCVDIASIIIADSENPPPATMSSAFRTLSDIGVIDHNLAERLSRAVGFRNIAIHEYHRIDWKIVYSIITVNINDFKEFVSAIIKYLDI